MAEKGKEKEKEKEQAGGDSETWVKETFKEFLTDWKNREAAGQEAQKIPVPKPQESQEKPEEKEKENPQEKKPGFLNWLLG